MEIDEDNVNLCSVKHPNIELTNLFIFFLFIEVYRVEFVIEYFCAKILTLLTTLFLLHYNNIIVTNFTTKLVVDDFSTL